MSRNRKAFISIEYFCKENAIFDAWKENHDYSANYAGSIPGMETEGGVRILKLYLEKHCTYFEKAESKNKRFEGKRGDKVKAADERAWKD